ncbi:MAG: hypothetical protein K5681_08885 [Treponema sp.]|nr:hypothetical protein [Treponema sp.]
MKRIFAIVITSLLFSSLAFCLEVDRSELQSISENTTIEFISYTGPHKKIDSAASIKGIGSSMGKVISADREKQAKTGNANKYSVIHAIDPSESGKLDADIIILGADAGVDHINNLRRIISGYLSSAYGYSEEDADTLAVFITVYNAVYRGKLSNAGKKYKKIVLDNVTEANFGLSVNYKDWPGHSEIIIPVYDAANGGLSSVDTSVISDSKVVNSMKEDDDRNVESRKNMVDIKERESDTASENAKNAQKEAVAEQKTADAEKKNAESAQKEADQAQKDADQAQQKADEAQQKADENPDDKDAQSEAEKAQAEADAAAKKADEAQAEADEAQQKADEAQERADQAKDEAQEKQALADKKQSEAQSERKEIAKDQQEIQKIEAEQADMPTDYGIVLFDEKEMLSRLVRYNSETGEVLKNSPVTSLRGRFVYKAGDNYIAIAGENSKNGAIKLVLISPETMEITSESDKTVAAESVLVEDASEYYCVIDQDGSYYIGKFGQDLSFKVMSQITVKAATPITLGSTTISVTDASGALKILDKSDLSDISSGK